MCRIWTMRIDKKGVGYPTPFFNGLLYFFLRYTGKEVTLAVDIFISEMNHVA